jgi:hypothetical protein
MAALEEVERREYPLYPQKRTSELGREMSALCQKRTHALQQNLFDHLVGAVATVARAEPLRAWLSGVVKSGV